MKKLPKIITVVGSTGAGKTDLGIILAKKFNGEIISVDSRQIYREMDIGTAKPEGEWVEEVIEVGGSIKQLFGSRHRFEVEGIPHWGIDLVNPDEDYNVSQFKAYAEKKIKEIRQRERLPILVGGTGLWIKAIIDNLSFPQVAPDTELRKELENRHLDDLFAEFKRLDPEGSKEIDRLNKRRIVRALEVCKKTGQPFSKQRKQGVSKFNVLQLGIKIDREVLNERIDFRVDVMVAKGLVDEVRKLKKKYGRQMTWFRRDERINWVANHTEALRMTADRFFE